MTKMDFLKQNADGSVTIGLTRGFVRDGAQINAVTMREPTVGDQIAAEAAGATNAAREIALFGALCQLTPAEVTSIKMKDYGRLQVAYRGFLD